MRAGAIVENAIIKNASLEITDRGVLSSVIFVDAESRSQGYGGYALFSPHSVNGKAAGLFIWRVLKIAGVSRWDQLPGKAVRIAINDDMIVAIGHIVKDDWFRYPEEVA